MMDFILRLLETAVTPALVVGAITYLAKWVLARMDKKSQEGLARDVERFKMELERENEKFKAMLQRESRESELRFAKLHELSTEALNDLFTSISVVYSRSNQYLNPMGQDREEIYSELVKAFHDMRFRISQYLIYVPKNIYDRCSAFAMTFSKAMKLHCDSEQERASHPGAFSEQEHWESVREHFKPLVTEIMLLSKEIREHFGLDDLQRPYTR